MNNEPENYKWARKFYEIPMNLVEIEYSVYLGHPLIQVTSEVN